MKNIEEIRHAALAAMHFESLNAMQQAMLETTATLADGGEARGDVMLLAPTGSGKTLAFLLPIWMTGQRTLVLSPSRELALQTAEVWQRLHTGMRHVVCYGGHDLRAEQAAMAEPWEVMIATPGRLKDHMERGNVDGGRFTRLVIDEYDKCLELGFEDDMRWIMARLTHLDCRTLTSATQALTPAAWTGFGHEVRLDYTGHEDPKPRIAAYQVKSPVADKLMTLTDLLATLLGDDADSDSQAIVFVNYREAAERTAHHLQDQDVACALYHGGLDQELRERSLMRLRGGSIRVLVCTDLGARGLDLPEVAHIIHYHFPADAEAWTHRNGRTARAGSQGTAYVIVGPDEVLPAHMPQHLPYYTLRRTSAGRHIAAARNVTVYVGRGKKDKISKGDVLGFFTKTGQLKGSDIGRIDIQEHCAFVAIRREVAREALARVAGQKIKGEKTIYKIV